MVIRYVDYLLRDCDRVYYSSLGIIGPAQFGESKTFEFSYQFTYDEEELDKQSKVFLNEVKSNSMLSRVVDLNISGNQSVKDEAVKNTYKYSFIKVFSLCYDFFISGKASLGAAPANSLVFYGHKELFLLFVTHNVFYHRMGTGSKTVINKQLSIDTNVIDDLKKTDVYTSSVNVAFPGYLSNPLYERLLDGFKSSGTDIQIEYLDSGRMSIDPAFTPLGNMAFRENQLVADFDYYIDSVTIPESHTDHISKYWNVANFIKLISYDDFFPSQIYPYISVSSLTIPSTSLFAQVESITGISCGSKFSNYGRGFPNLSGYVGPTGYNPSPSLSPKGSPSGSGESPYNHGPNGKGKGNGSGGSPQRGKPNGRKNNGNKRKQSAGITGKEENQLLIALARARDSGVVQDLVSFAKDAALMLYSKKLDEYTAQRLQREAIESSGYSEETSKLYTRFGIVGSETNKFSRTPLLKHNFDQNEDSFQ